MGKQPIDLEIDYPQRLLSPHLNAIQSNLFQQNSIVTTDQVNENKIQIVFCNNRQH